MDLVSVIIPSYNKAEQTRQCVESVIHQTYPEVEIIVVDDGSTDRTLKILQQYNQIRIISQQNCGACAARNRGLREAKGKFIGFLDCDDLYEPEKIAKSVKFLQSNIQIGFVHTAVLFIDEKGCVTGRYDHPNSRKEGWLCERLLMGNFICNSTVIARKSLIQKVGGFNENIFTPGDWDMWLKFAQESKGGYIRESLTRYRISSQYILKKLDQAYNEELIVLNNIFSNCKKNRYLSGKAYSCLELRFSQCYLLKNDRVKFKIHLKRSFKRYVLNFKAWLMLIGFAVCRQTLIRHLSKKILRA